VVSRHDYKPFGEEVDAGEGGRDQIDGYVPAGGDPRARERFTGKPRDPSGLDYFGARYYSSAIGRFSTPDLVFADQQPDQPQTWNLYSYGRNSPLVFVDPRGTSTHTAVDGTVVAVYDDDDLGVYRHGFKKWSGQGRLAGTDSDATRMGRTHVWDDFMEHDDKTGKATGLLQDARIAFGESLDQEIDFLNDAAKLMSPLQLAAESANGGAFDIKERVGASTGRLLRGEYVTGRSAGNYLAGLNAVSIGLSEDTFMRAVGALQQGRGKKMEAIVALLTNREPAPYFGEAVFSGFYSRIGYWGGRNPQKLPALKR